MPDDVIKIPEGTVTPSVEPAEVLPGQPEPIVPGSSEPSPDVKPQEVDEKTVPLAALQEERSKRQELQAEMEVLKQVAGDNVLFDMNGRPVPQKQAAPGERTPGTSSSPTQVTQELEKLWESDPRKAVQVEIMAAMTYRDDLESRVDNQIVAASAKYPDFPQYEGTVRQYVRALPLEQRAQKGVADLAYYVVKGQQSGNAVEKAKAEVLRKIQAGENVQGLQPGTKAAPQTPKGTQLNEEQLKVADAMGLTPEQYMSAMKK